MDVVGPGRLTYVGNGWFIVLLRHRLVKMVVLYVNSAGQVVTTYLGACVNLAVSGCDTVGDA